MKKLIYFLIAFIIVAFSSCDIVDPPFEIDDPNGPPTPTDSVVKNVLLEDYTGHTCVYCAGAALEAHDLQVKYGDRLIVMAVHAGYFAEPVPSDPYLTDDFRTTAGETWNDFFKVSGNPVGVVDREETGQGYLVSVGQWNSRIAQELEKPAEVEITIENQFNEQTNVLTTNITTKFITAVNIPVNILVCVTQDSIISGQKNNDPSVGETPLIEQYVFMDMLRGSLNSPWGESITSEYPIPVNEEFFNSYIKEFPSDWIPKNCHVVAFVFNAENKYVMQVEEAAVLGE